MTPAHTIQQRLNIGMTVCCLLLGSVLAQSKPGVRPNILWITSEDNGPHLGAYGDLYAHTPNLDRLAAKGLKYLNAWSTSPVCAPARTTIISGLYPPSTGSQHMRSMTQLPNFIRMYPQYLREAGYYCTNNSKEDYNLQKPGIIWDESSDRAHWRNRPAGQPFFAIFNHTVSHESQIRVRPHTPVHDPAGVRVPSYHPDTPVVRRDWAQYYDKITEMDARVGENLKELEEAGLTEDTIIFYYGDHGSGMPRSKRWPYNSGLNVPLIIYIPEKFKHLRPQEYVAGRSTDRLVGFIDLAPTLLSLVGIQPPSHMQGNAFMGAHEAPSQAYLFGFRGRMDERYDMVRSVRNSRYIYIRNYMPHKIYGQYLNYMFQTPTTREWRRLYDEGLLTAPQTYFWESKPAEELYDLKNDPDEVKNLAESSDHQNILRRLRKAQQDLAFKIRDLGFLPEDEIHSRPKGMTPYELGHSEKDYPLKTIMAVADLATSPGHSMLSKLQSALTSRDSAARYWAALGILMRGKRGVESAGEALHKSLTDPSPSVRVICAQALGQFGSEHDLEAALPVLIDLSSLDENSLYVSMLALNALDALDDKAANLAGRISQLPTTNPSLHRRMRNYVPRLIEKILADLD